MSAVTSVTMTSRISAARMASASNSRPKMLEKRVILLLRLILRGIAQRCVSKHGAAPCFETGAPRPPQHEAAREGRDRSSIPRQLPQLRRGVGCALDHRLPGDVVRLVEEFLRLGGSEVDWLDAG